MSSKPETKLSRECIAWIENNGGKVIKIHGNEFMEAGTPDHIGAIEVGWASGSDGSMDVGRGLFDSEWVHFAIELKLPGEEPRRKQQYELDEWAKRGFKTGTAHSLDEYKAIILD